MSNWAFDVNVFVYHDNKADTELFFDTEKSIESLTLLNNMMKYTPPSYLEGLGAEKQSTADNDIAILIAEGHMLAHDKADALGIADRFTYLPTPKTLDGKSYTAHSGSYGTFQEFFKGDYSVNSNVVYFTNVLHKLTSIDSNGILMENETYDWKSVADQHLYYEIFEFNDTHLLSFDIDDDLTITTGVIFFGSSNLYPLE